MQAVRSKILFVALACLVPLPAAAGGADEGLGDFLERIQSTDDGVRMKARLEAPRWGAPAVLPLARLMAGDNREAAITARHALSMIAHRAGRPGAEAERKPVLDELVELTRAGPTDYARREAIHLIGLIGGDEQVPVLAERLADRGLQVGEAARLALERIPGKAAALALQGAIRRFGDDRKPDLIFSLGKKGIPEMVPFLLEQADSPSDEVRFAAFQALAHMGAGEAVEPLKVALSKPQAPLRRRLFGEFLRLADELFVRGHLDTARDMRLHALREAPLDYQRERAFLTLAKPGDVKAIDVLLIGLNDPAPRVRRRAMWTLESLEGAAVFGALRRGYDEAKDEARPLILRALAKIDVEATKELLHRAASSENPELKISAEDLLGRLGDPSMESAYLEIAREGSSFARPLAFQGYLAVAEKRLAAGAREKALEMFSGALDLAQEAEEKRQALKGFIAVGDSGAIDRLGSLLRDPVLAKEAAAGYVRFAAEIGARGDVDRAEEFLRTIVGGQFSLEIVNRAAVELRKIGRDPQDAARQQGFVLGWWVVGPIQDDGKGMERSYFPEERVRLGEQETIGPRRYRWKKLRHLCLTGRVDLVPEFRRSENVIAYGYAEIEMPEERQALLKMGSDDGIACWVNGERVHYKPQPRSYQLDQDSAPARLKKGKNTILVKISQGGGGWEFSLRVTDPSGKPLDLRRR